MVYLRKSDCEHCVFVVHIEREELKHAQAFKLSVGKELRLEVQ